MRTAIPQGTGLTVHAYRLHSLELMPVLVSTEKVGWTLHNIVQFPCSSCIFTGVLRKSRCDQLSFCQVMIIALPFGVQVVRVFNS